MHPFKPLNGMYPGSGVAPGGQLGRPKLMHNGVTGTRPGGSTPGASQRRPGLTGPGVFRPDFLPRRPAPMQVQVPRPVHLGNPMQLIASLLDAAYAPRG